MKAKRIWIASNPNYDYQNITFDEPNGEFDYQDRDEDWVDDVPLIQVKWKEYILLEVED